MTEIIFPFNLSIHQTSITFGLLALHITRVAVLGALSNERWTLVWVLFYILNIEVYTDSSVFHTLDKGFYRLLTKGTCCSFSHLVSMNPQDFKF